MAFETNLRCAIGVGMLFTLAGCGADGGGGVNSVSGSSAETGTTTSVTAPVPVTPASLSPSTSFSNRMQSGGFTTVNINETTTGPALGSPNGTPNTVQVTPADKTNFISYNAATNVYTLNTTDASGSARKADFSATGPRPTIVASGSPDPTEVNFYYSDCYTSGCYGSSYLVSHTGTSGFVYTYTAFASITSSSQPSVGSSSVGNDVAVFGFATPASTVPRTGSANYTLDLVGSYPGTGTGTVNFGNNSYNFSGSIAQSVGTTQTTGTFQSTGTLASTSNAFSGTINLTVNQTTANGVNNNTFAGTIGGAFFGPTAQELGGAFVALNTSSKSTATSYGVPGPAVGVILGHR